MKAIRSFFHANKQPIKLDINMNMPSDISEKSEPKKMKKQECQICSKKVKECKSICGYKKCEGKVCDKCVRTFFKQTKKGTIVQPGQILCPFCRNDPRDAKIKKYNKDSLQIIHELKSIEETYYYGWCNECNHLKIAFQKECTRAGPPTLKKFTCDKCVEKDIKKSKKCPHCGIQTKKLSGCNHIQCPSNDCKVHWCYVCGYKARCSNKVYAHMDKEHGGMDSKVKYKPHIEMDTSDASSDCSSSSSEDSYGIGSYESEISTESDDSSDYSDSSDDDEDYEEQYARDLKRALALSKIKY